MLIDLYTCSASLFVADNFRDKHNEEKLDVGCLSLFGLYTGGAADIDYEWDYSILMGSLLVSAST